VAETVAEILDAYRAGTATPEAIIARSFARKGGRSAKDPCQ